jgi:hypothetical protein
MVREAVGVFDSQARLEAAVEQLGSAGIDLAAISVLGKEPHTAHPGPGGAVAPPRSITDISDDPTTPTTEFVSDVSWSEARGLASSVPLFIGGFGAAWAVAATGGALLLAVGATIATGAAGAGLGALLYNAVARPHETAIHDQMAQGGLILWVRVEDDAKEERALAVLRACGASSVHTHVIDRPWALANSPLQGVEPDPFLTHDPSVDAA